MLLQWDGKGVVWLGGGGLSGVQQHVLYLNGVDGPGDDAVAITIIIVAFIMAIIIIIVTVAVVMALVIASGCCQMIMDFIGDVTLSSSSW